MKYCPLCKLTKLHSEFDKQYKNSDKPYHLQSYCRPCNVIRMREYERTRVRLDGHRSGKYGSTNFKTRQAIIKTQGGVCPICKCDIEDGHVDHDHITGKIRGVLHRDCNIMLGMYHDNIEWHQNSIDYINRHV